MTAQSFPFTGAAQTPARKKSRTPIERLPVGTSKRVHKKGLGEVVVTVLAAGYQVAFTAHGVDYDRTFPTISAAAKFVYMHEHGYGSPQDYRQATGKPLPGVNWGYFGKGAISKREPPPWIVADHAKLPDYVLEHLGRPLATIDQLGAKLEKPTWWLDWIPPAGVFFHAMVDGRDIYVTQTMGSLFDDNKPNIQIQFYAIDPLSGLGRGDLVNAKNASKSLTTALERIGIVMAGVEARTKFRLNDPIAPGTTYRMIANGDGVPSFSALVGDAKVARVPPSKPNLTPIVVSAKLSFILERLGLEVEVIGDIATIADNGTLEALDQMAIKYGIGDVVEGRRQLDGAAYLSIPSWVLAQTYALVMPYDEALGIHQTRQKGRQQRRSDQMTSKSTSVHP